MREWERFQNIRKQKVILSLNARLTLLIGLTVLISILIAFGIVTVLELLFPSITSVPLLIQLNVLSLIVAFLAARYISKIFLSPIRDLREGMKQIADGNFDVRLETSSSSSEVQEVIAGFNMMAQELSSTEILQTDFVANVSHEFKTPIGAIEGYATLLQSTDNIDEVENEYIEKILAGTGRLSSLVSNILLLSKLESQSIITNKEFYSLDEQIRESILSLESVWDPKNIEFDVQLDSVSYYGNEGLMYHVWTNLIGNACKFAPEGGHIKILLECGGDSIRFVVEDDGPGLSEETQKHLFDKFYQADSSHRQEGNGLGLALVKDIVDISGGSIFAENTKDGGCRMTVTLKTE